jgi:molecular chaperone GrpE
VSAEQHGRGGTSSTGAPAPTHRTGAGQAPQDEPEAGEDLAWADETSDQPSRAPGDEVTPEPGEDLSFGEGAVDTAGTSAAEPAGGAEAAASRGDASDPGAGAGEISVEDLVQDLERVTQERDQYLDTSRRLQAELENYRKQVAKREAEARERANEGLIAEILPVLDACDGALASGAADVEPVRTALIDALVKQGLDRIEDEDSPFDPARHDAVMHEPDESGEGPVVAEVMRAGYAWKGRVVRPAMVKVRG